MADVVYSAFRRSMFQGGIDLEKDTLRVMLVTDAYKPDRSHRVRSDVKGEVQAEGYEAGGQELTGCRILRRERGQSISAADIFDANDVVWERLSVTAKGAVIYHDSGKSETSLLVRYVDFKTNVTSTDGPFAVSWSANGIMDLIDVTEQ